MKNLTIITHTDAQQKLADQLRTLEQISGYTFIHVEGHGLETENDPFFAAREKTVGYTSRVRVDIVLEDADVEVVLATLRDKAKGITGQGVYWISPVEQSGRL